MKPIRLTLTGALLASTAIMMPRFVLAQDEGPTAQSDETITILGQFVPDEKRDTSEISNILDAEALARTQDSDIANALQRLTGLSLDEGRFVIVRGLNERYSRATLNGSPLPSNEPLRNVVPLDIFPTSILEGVLVQKTFSPEFGLDFGGGLLELRTVGVPNEEFFEIGASFGYNTVTSFDRGFTYAGSDFDWTGTNDIDDFRTFPSGTIPRNLNTLSPGEREIAGESLPNVWSVQEDDSIPPDLSFNAAYGNRWELGGESALGFVLVADYGNSWFTKDGLRRDIRTTDQGFEIQDDFSSTGQGCDESPFECGFFETVQSIDLNALASVGLNIDNNNEIKVTSLILRKTTKEALLQTGFEEDQGQILQDGRLDWIERQTWSNQITGDHYLPILSNVWDNFGETNINWRGSYSEAKRDVRNRKDFLYEQEPDGVFRLDSRILESNQTTYASLEDENWQVGIDIKQPVSIWDIDVELKFGAAYEESERASELRRFLFAPAPGVSAVQLIPVREQIPEIIFGRINVDPNGYVLQDNTVPSDAFLADFENVQFYAGFDAQLTQTLRIAAGFRYEDSEQNTTSFARTDLICGDFFGGGALPPVCRGPDASGATVAFANGDAIPVTLRGEFLLPAVTATWEFLPNNQIRAGFSQTINRPTLRELSTSPFLDPDRDVEIEGFPFLNIAEVDNYDIRWEWYFAAREFVTVGVFYKQIDNPIELTFTPFGNEVRRSFRNGTEAELIGVEAEIQKNLNFQDWFGFDFLGSREFYINANFTYIDSETTIAFDPLNIITNETRELQGQSDILANVQFGFQDFDRGERGAILFNFTGERVETVGVLGLPETFERPPALLDVVYSKEIAGFFGGTYELSFEARNLLDDDYVLEQGGITIEQYDLGRTFSVGVTARY